MQEGRIHMRHIVIDIETLSKRHNAMIASIGAVIVEDQPNATIGIRPEVLDICIDLSTYPETHNYHIDPETFLWWLQQPQQARESLQGGTHSLLLALQELREFVSAHCDSTGDIRVYGNGPNFDMGILEFAFRSEGVQVPWLFHQVRCIRTVCESFDVNWKKHRDPNTAHDAVSDALAEALGLCDCLHAKRRHKAMEAQSTIAAATTPPWKTPVSAAAMTPPPAQGVPAIPSSPLDHQTPSLSADKSVAARERDARVDWEAMAEGAISEQEARVEDAKATVRSAFAELIEVLGIANSKPALSEALESDIEAICELA